MATQPADHATAISLTLLPERMAICRMSPNEAVPEWTNRSRSFLSITRTASELSIVADETVVPSDGRAERGYRMLRVEGPLPLELVGVFAAVATPLAIARVPIFPLATHDTDYMLVREELLSLAIGALTSAGHVVTDAATGTD